MARFGMDLMPPVRASTKIRPAIAAYGAVMPWYDAELADNLDEVYRFIIDGEEFSLTSGGRRRVQRRRGDPLFLLGPRRATRSPPTAAMTPAVLGLRLRRREKGANGVTHLLPH